MKNTAEQFLAYALHAVVMLLDISGYRIYC